MDASKAPTLREAGAYVVAFAALINSCRATSAKEVAEESRGIAELAAARASEARAAADIGKSAAAWVERHGRDADDAIKDGDRVRIHSCTAIAGDQYCRLAK
jgi:hypothetical protein